MLKRKQPFTGFILGIFLFAVAILPVTAFAQNYEDSPFGFNTLFGGGSNDPIIVKQTLIEQFSELNDLGVGSVRGPCKAGVPWNYIEPTEGDFYFELSDILMVQAHNSGISFLPLIFPYNKWVQACYGNNPDPQPFPKIYCEGYEDEYINYVKEVVERYDGDEDFGNYVISEETKNAIRNSPWLNWEIMNEPFNHYFEGTSDEYEQILDVSYSAIKEKCQNCNVLIAGYSQEVYYAGVYGTNPGGQSIPQAMQDTANGFLQIPFNSNSYDIMNFHVYAETDLITEQYNYYNNQETWMTEVGYPSVEVPIPNTNPPLIWGESTSEKVQAETLIKRFVVGFSVGIKKIFWHTWHDNDIDPFGNTGVITSQGNKKLSYYSYKLLIEKLEDFDLDSITTVINNDNNKYAYKFINDSTGELTYAAWWDYFNDPAYISGDSSLITLTGISSNHVIITNAVPTDTSGDYITDYNTAFQIDTLNVSGGSISFYLKEYPVFVEEISNTSIEETGSITPNEFQLNQNYPNPFNPQTTISYQLPVNGDVTLKIYNMLGQEVRTLINGNKAAGYHSVVWDGTDNADRQVSSGVYFYSLELDNLSACGHAQADNLSQIEAKRKSRFFGTNKMLLIK